MSCAFPLPMPRRSPSRRQALLSLLRVAQTGGGSLALGYGKRVMNTLGLKYA